MLKNNIILIFCSLFLPQLTWAELKEKYIDFVPPKWKIIEEVHGDLNMDHVTDVAMIIEDTNPQNIIKNESLGNPELNINPRKLLVLFNTPHGYKLIANNAKLPTAGDIESPCLADPLGESDALEIKNNVLKVQLYYWLSCGSWYTTNHTYTFRYKDSLFKLIGYDSYSFHRASGDIVQQSINFLTHKIKTITGDNQFNETTIPSKIEWSTLKRTYNLNLNTFNFMTDNTFE